MLRVCLGLLLLVGLFGCSRPPSQAPVSTATASSQAKSDAHWSLALADHEAVSILPDTDPVEVRWGSHRATAKVEADRVKLLEGQKLLAKVKAKDRGFELEDEAGARVLRVKFGKTLKVEDAGDQLVLEGRRQGQTFLLQGPGQKPLGTLGQAGSLAYWDSPQGARLASLDGVSRWESVLALACPGLTPPQRAALVIYMNRVME